MSPYMVLHSGDLGTIGMITQGLEKRRLRGLLSPAWDTG